MVQIAHIVRGWDQHLAPNDLRSLVPPNLDHWHPPLTGTQQTSLSLHLWTTQLYYELIHYLSAIL